MKIFIIVFQNGGPWLPRYRVLSLKNGLTAGKDFSITNPLSDLKFSGKVKKYIKSALNQNILIILIFHKVMNLGRQIIKNVKKKCFRTRVIHTPKGIEIILFQFKTLFKVTLTYPENFKTNSQAVLEIFLPAVIDIGNFDKRNKFNWQKIDI